jgi:hypothetical protein
MAGALLAGPVLAACALGPTYDQWAATDGAAGRINLDQVQEAFKKSKSASDFERRVNEIYEGDGLVIIRAQQDGETLVLEGWEDLNANTKIDDATDDLLFSIVEKEDKENELRGHGANSYYRSGFGGGNFLFTYMLISTLSPRGYYYQTPSTSRDTRNMRSQRNSYRASSKYRTQVSNNSKYFTQKKSFAGTGYNDAGKRLSTSRQRYLSTQKSTGRYLNSRTGVRSSWGSSSRGGTFGRASSGGLRGGGFRGGGGAQAIIGTTRSPL